VSSRRIIRGSTRLMLHEPPAHGAT
jgi:hypothetical protein